MEQGAPVFSGGLSKGNKNDFENVQKQAFKIILRGKFHNYQKALNTLSQDTLEERRSAISLKFAKKSVKHPKLKHLFRKKENDRTRTGTKFIEQKMKSARGENGPINYFIRLLNKNNI